MIPLRLYALAGIMAGTVVEAYDDTTNAWSTSVAPMPTERNGLAVATLENKVYVYGGMISGSGGTPTNTADVYDPSLDSWMPIAPMARPRGRGGGAALNGKLYAVGGHDGENLVFETEVYDPQTDIWTDVAGLPVKRDFLAVTTLDSFLYALGGKTSDSTITALLTRYDPSTNSWTDLAPMSTPRNMLAAVGVQGKVYAIGGHDTTMAALASVEAYDPSTNTWTLVAPLVEARQSFAAGVLNNKIYAVGGMRFGAEGMENLASVEVYDSELDSWDSVAPMMGPRDLFAVAVAP